MCCIITPIRPKKHTHVIITVLGLCSAQYESDFEPYSLREGYFNARKTIARMCTVYYVLPSGVNSFLSL